MAKRAAREEYVSDRLIPGVGPQPADGMLVGEAGGESEHHRQRPFCGKSGDVLTTYLRAANCPRPDLRITNTYPFWTGPGNPDPTPDQIRREEWRLVKDIAKTKPKVIGTVGRIATQWFLGDVDLDACHGVPSWSKRAPDSLIVPIYHPAAGFYRPELAAFSQEDFMRFAFYLQNPVKQLPPPDVRVVESVNAPYEISGAVDTEGLEDRPWGLSWSIDGRTTNVWIKQGSRAPRLKGRIVFHNALHDLKILRSMGISTDRLDYDDTMVKLYLLQLEPQGLKAAAYRHLGLRMMSFDDVVRPHFNKVALRYLNKAAAMTFPKPRPQPIADYTKRKWRLYKPWDAGRRVKSALQSWTKREKQIADGTATTEDPIKLEKKWSDLGEAYRDQIETAVGDAFPDFSIFCVPRKEAVHYSGVDAAATALLNPVLDKLIDARGLRGVYETDRRYIPFVDKMQETGMRVEVPLLRELETELESLQASALDKVQRIVEDRWFNPGSDDQVRRWLYKSQGIPIDKWTDGGTSGDRQGSTSIVALKMIQGYHGADYPLVADFAAGVRQYRETQKYLSTFILPIFENMRRDRYGNWRIHPNYRITRVVSGRNSSHDPNVMAFPTRTELGKKIRKCFRAMEGWKVVAVDASQIELRMMAHLCRDRRMRDAFEQGLDLHAITASELFRVPLDNFKKPMLPMYEAMRYVAKTINFAVMYGITARALLEQLYKADIFTYTLEDCQRFIAEWFKLFSAVQVFLRSVWDKAERDGYVRDMWGRMCYVPNLRVGDDKMREAARRLAGNMPVQGGARGLVKRAQIKTHEWLLEENRYSWARPWLDMHDELTSEVREDMAEPFALQVQEFFCADQDMMRVPIKAEYGIGDSWASAK